ncbi:MAG: LLM class F420-dependent oxidoreductase [Acidimicrobiales bacterium]
MIRLGLQIPNFTYSGVPDDQLFERIAAQAVAAEESGFDSVWVMDHFYQLPMIGPSSNAMLEAYSLLSALAARTTKVSLGTLVTGVTYRYPAVLAKQVTTLDVISGGRAILGIGAAWNQEEHDAYGIPFPAAGERLDRLEDALQICRAMFTRERATVEGTHSAVVDAMNNPRPIRPDGIPILVGGGGEKRTLRLVAEYADACNLFGGPDDVRHKLEVLAGHCEAVGRDPADVTKTRLGSVAIGATHADAEASLRAGGLEPARASMYILGSPEEVTDQVGTLLETGLDGLIFNMAHTSDPDEIRLAGATLSPLLR